MDDNIFGFGRFIAIFFGGNHRIATPSLSYTAGMTRIDSGVFAPGWEKRLRCGAAAVPSAIFRKRFTCSKLTKVDKNRIWERKGKGEIPYSRNIFERRR